MGEHCTAMFWCINVCQAHAIALSILFPYTSLLLSQLHLYNLMLFQATYNIIHNGSGQILGVDVDIVLGEIQSNQNSYIQSYAIRFQHQVKCCFKWCTCDNYCNPYRTNQHWSTNGLVILDMSLVSLYWLVHYPLRIHHFK